MDLCASLSLCHSEHHVAWSLPTIIVLCVTGNRGTSHTKRKLFHWSYPKTFILPSSISNSIALHDHYLESLQVMEVRASKHSTLEAFNTDDFNERMQQTFGWRNGSSRLEDQGLERYMYYVIFIFRALMINFLLFTKNLMFVLCFIKSVWICHNFQIWCLMLSVMICIFLFVVGLHKKKLKHIDVTTTDSKS